MQNRPTTSAIILAAGIGRRLGADGHPPKVMLKFDGRTLLERHLNALDAAGIAEVSITVGYEQAMIEDEIGRLGRGDRVSLVCNPDYRQGSLVSLRTQAARLRSGDAVLLMDGDVLYDDHMIQRLVQAEGENVLLIDRDIEPGDEPVKICFRGSRIVDFRKRPERAHDWYGESVGFFRFSGPMANALAGRCEDYVARGRTDLEYEEAIRDLILAEPDRFSAHDISDLPWIEIDFEADVLRARAHVLPQLRRT
ncbi:phosphocholine cytidylyltransferase family protein [Roseicella aquatilis]|uniref:phosphocholine cytidylyltransferase family protein n=1 Tax=Roseicella aquatilis TaxID=2527868 RepID=UPI001F0F0333|nr:phosphocholine cytidylyltransferase family protein [Roseicella aquatilis]